MNKKIILFIFTVLIFIGSSLAFTGESSSYSARASTGISPLNNSYLKSTNPELNWSNSTDPEEFSHILYILELSDNINFQYFNYSNNSIRETNNVKIGRASCRE